MDDRSRWANVNNPYVYRNDNIARMGFSSYREYLASPIWKAIKRRVLERMDLGGPVNE